MYDEAKKILKEGVVDSFSLVFAHNSHLRMHSEGGEQLSNAA